MPRRRSAVRRRISRPHDKQVVFSSVIVFLQDNGCNHPVATRGSQLSKRPTSRLGCIAWLSAPAR
ncbi:MAG: hypothetical protein FJ308_16185 [Planctomycetes bacterium]|nr:hypothetical protein [Planctomycetota bacterium]